MGGPQTPSSGGGRDGAKASLPQLSRTPGGGWQPLAEPGPTGMWVPDGTVAVCV